MREIEALLQYAVRNNLMESWDIIQKRNELLTLLRYAPEEVDEALFNVPDRRAADETPTAILEALADGYAARGHLPTDTVDEHDRFYAAVMGLCMPRMSETLTLFMLHYMESPVKATEYFFKLCRASNYIQTDRIKKNLYWQTETEYGALEITVNLSKPEKDPLEIAEARTATASDYPRCLLCAENIGFTGNAKQNLRAIPLRLDGEPWYFQYSPYAYYNEHCIILSEKHVPMHMSERVFIKLIEFINDFPHYFIGANADLPIVGGSMLYHDHFQGGRHIFPMEKAEAYVSLKHEAYPDIVLSLVKWPLSVIRLTAVHSETEGISDNAAREARRAKTERQMITLATHIFTTWQAYTDPDADIVPYTGETPHNTLTPIARYNRMGRLEMDLVLRNNRTSAVHPLGIFHPHAEWHHIKKENIGLIEVMGLAVLPGRLKDELDSGTLTRDEVGRIFTHVLRDCGVFKDNAEGRAQFVRFVETVRGSDG